MAVLYPRPRCEPLQSHRPRCEYWVGLAVGICGLGKLWENGSGMVVCAVGVCMAESILTMPVVTTLFRNLFDNIFTHFYGCRTVFNGVGPVAHPHITISSSVWKVDSVLHRATPGATVNHTASLTVPTLRNT